MIEIEATQKFSGLAEIYALGRPGYANALADALYCQHGFSRQSIIADIGSGTGKFSRILLDRGSFVYGVEPNADMRAKALRELSGYANFRAVDGTASETGLEDNSVDFITAAQAFHWFDVAQFKRECARILKKNGQVFLIWNIRDNTDAANQRCAAVFTQYCPDFKGFSGGLEENDPRIRDFFNDQYAILEFDHPLVYTEKDAFIRRCLSSSYSLKEGMENYPQYLSALETVFDECAANHVLTLANKTTAYYGTLH